MHLAFWYNLTKLFFAAFLKPNLVSCTGLYWKYCKIGLVTAVIKSTQFSFIAAQLAVLKSNNLEWMTHPFQLV